MRFLNVPREMEFHLTIERAERLRIRGLFDVMDMPTKPEQLRETIADPQRFASILWELTDQESMTFAQFASAIEAANGEELIDIFFGELFGFFHGLTTSVVNSLASEASKLQRLLNRSEVRTNSSDDVSPIGSPSGNSPESVESILANTHFANST